MDVGEENGLPPGGEEEHGGHNGLGQHGGRRRSGDLHPGKGAHPEDHQGVQQDIAHQSHRRGPQDHHTAAHGGKQAGEDLVEEGEQKAQGDDHQIDPGVRVDLRAVQLEKGDQRSVEEHAHSGEQDDQQRPQMEGGLSITGGALRILGPQLMGHLHLSPQPGDHGQPVGQPQIHTRRPHRRHCVRRESADPDHIGHIIGHLDQRGRHNRQRQAGEAPDDGALQQVYVSCHRNPPYRCISIGNQLSIWYYIIEILLCNGPVVSGAALLRPPLRERRTARRRASFLALFSMICYTGLAVFVKNIEFCLKRLE